MTFLNRKVVNVYLPNAAFQALLDLQKSKERYGEKPSLSQLATHLIIDGLEKEKNNE